MRFLREKSRHFGKGQSVHPDICLHVCKLCAEFHVLLLFNKTQFKQCHIYDRANGKLRLELLIMFWLEEVIHTVVCALCKGSKVLAICFFVVDKTMIAIVYNIKESEKV